MLAAFARAGPVGIECAWTRDEFPLFRDSKGLANGQPDQSSQFVGICAVVGGEGFVLKFTANGRAHC